MGTAYASRQSTYTQGDTINADDTNDEFDAIISAFGTSGHSHDGTSGEGGAITKLLSNTLTFGAGTSGTDITITFDGESNDGVLYWMEDEDYFKFSDDVLINSTEKIMFGDTASFIHQSSDGVLTIDGEATIDLNASTAVLVSNDLKLNSDAAVLGFGADNDVTLTHVADTGLLLNSTMAIQFNDASQYINAPSATVLDINATDEVEVNATLMDVNANLEVSGTSTFASDVTFTGASYNAVWDNSDNALEFADNAKAKFGNSGDLEIYAASGASYVKDVGSGSFNIMGTNLFLLDAAGEYKVGAVSDGAVTLYHDNSAAKLATKSDGVDVTGELQADSLDIDGNSQLDGTLTVGVNDTGYDVKFFGDTANAYMLWDTSADDLILAEPAKLGVGAAPNATFGSYLYTEGTPTANKPIIGAYSKGNSNTGGIGLFNDSGNRGIWTTGSVMRFTRTYEGNSTDDMIINASGVVGIGTAAPDSNHKLEVYGTGTTEVAIRSGNSSEAIINFGDVDSRLRGRITYNNTNEYMAFWANAGEKMRLDTGGRLLINKTTLQTVNAPLQVASGLGTGQIFVGNTSGTGWMFGRDNTSTGNFVLGELANDADTSVTGFLTLETGTGLLMIQGSASSYDTTPSQAGLSLYYETDTGAATIGTYSSGGATRLAFSTNTGGGANAERLRIEGAGSVWTPTVSGANNNLRLGYLAGEDIASGANYNTLIGDSAGKDINTGDKNVAVGYNALSANTTASDNTAVGNSSAGLNTTGNGNVAVGHSALYANVLGAYSTVVGTYALDAQAPSGSTSMYNSAFGAYAGSELTTGLQNTFIGGQSAGAGVVTGNNNTAVGYISGYDITSGDQNTFLGAFAGYENKAASYNTFLGAYCGFSTDTGTHNTVVGRYAAYSMTSGHNNVVIGENACSNTSNEELTTAGYCIAIGNNVNVGSATADYQVVIGTSGTVGKGASTAFLNPNSGASYQGDNNASWTTTSDRRIKKNISDNNVGLDAINQIRVRNYEYRKPEEITDLPSHLAVEKEGVQVGVVAQEIREVLPNVVKEEEETGFLSVSNDDVTWHLVNAVKELSAKVKELEEKLNG